MEENNNQNDINEEDLKNENLHIRARYNNHLTEEQDQKSKYIRFVFSEMYKCLDEIFEGKSSREASLAYTKLEEAQSWAIKSITYEGMK